MRIRQKKKKKYGYKDTVSNITLEGKEKLSTVWIKNTGMVN